ncbi:MAG: NAD(P)-dependent oxidoreductase, partial [Solirubrobacteraceae bacterium]
VGLMLSLLRQVPAAVRHVRAGGWDRDLFWGQELYRKSVGIVGYGRLGRLVARYLVAFGARRVLVCDQPGRAVADLDEGVKACSLDELLSRSDIVTLHASLNDSTRGLLGARELALMPTGSWLVNTARGALVVEDALVAALRDGPLAGAALDVLADEHGDRSRQLLDYARANANVLITPHIGGATIESRAKTEELMVAPLAEFLATERAGRPPASDG